MLVPGVGHLPFEADVRMSAHKFDHLNRFVEVKIWKGASRDGLNVSEADEAILMKRVSSKSEGTGQKKEKCWPCHTSPTVTISLGGSPISSVKLCPTPGTCEVK